MVILSTESLWKKEDKMSEKWQARLSVKFLMNTAAASWLYVAHNQDSET